MLFIYATELYLSGLSDSYNLSPRSLVWLYMIKSKKDNELLKFYATASRLGQAEQKDFEKFINIIDND